LLLRLRHCWLGVDLFFVLSGFLITGILLDTREHPAYFKNFYARRFLRILPLYFCCIVVMSFQYPGSGSYFLVSVLFLANLAGLFGVAVPHGPGVFWSLAVEEHFYLLWPVLNRVLHRRMFALLAILLVVLTSVARIIFAAHGLNTNEEVYLYSWFRFDGLALGALLAMWVRSPHCSRRTTLLLAAGLAGACLLITIGGLPFHIMSSGTPAAAGLRSTQAQFVFAAAIAASLALQGHRLTSILGSSFMRLSGDLSYCIYLVHLTVGDAYDPLMRYLHINAQAHVGETWAAICKMVFLVAVSFGIAAISKRWFEDPILRLKRHFESR